MPIEYRGHAFGSSTSGDVTKIAVIDLDSCLFNGYFYYLFVKYLLKEIIAQQPSTVNNVDEILEKVVKIAFMEANQGFFSFLQSEGFKEFFNGSVRQSKRLDYLNAKDCLLSAFKMRHTQSTYLSYSIQQKLYIASILDKLYTPTERGVFCFTAFYIFPFIEEQYNMTYLKFLSPDVYSNQAIGSTYNAFDRTLSYDNHAPNLFDSSKILDMTAKLHILSSRAIVSVFDDRHDIIYGLAGYFSQQSQMIPYLVEALNFYIYKSENYQSPTFKFVRSIKGAGLKKDAYPLTIAMAKKAFELDLNVNRSMRSKYNSYDEFQANGFEYVGSSEFSAVGYLKELSSDFFDAFNLSEAMAVSVVGSENNQRASSPSYGEHRFLSNSSSTKSTVEMSYAEEETLATGIAKIGL